MKKLKKRLYVDQEGNEIKLTDKQYLHYPFNAKLTRKEE